jgi:hypothetical protein
LEVLVAVAHWWMRRPSDVQHEVDPTSIILNQQGMAMPNVAGV